MRIPPSLEASRPVDLTGNSLRNNCDDADLHNPLAMPGMCCDVSGMLFVIKLKITPTYAIEIATYTIVGKQAGTCSFASAIDSSRRAGNYWPGIEGISAISTIGLFRLLNADGTHST